MAIEAAFAWEYRRARRVAFLFQKYPKYAVSAVCYYDAITQKIFILVVIFIQVRDTQSLTFGKTVHFV